MDLRKQRYGPNSYLKQSQSRDHLKNMNESGGADKRVSFGKNVGFESFTGHRTYKEVSPPATHSPLRSASQEEARLIEQRHEELKRQIALKEKQLADMTGERESVNALRKRLGLKDFTEEDESYDKKRFPTQTESAKRGFYSSVSPDHSSPMLPSMVGLKSTTYNRPTSHEKSSSRLIALPEIQQSKFAQKYGQGMQYPGRQQEEEQLQFHPTRLPTKIKKQSPLRSRSRSKEAVGEYHQYSQPKYSPFSKGRSGGSSASPHEDRDRYTIIEEEESEQQQSDRIINPKKVQPLKSSGRPVIEDTFKNRDFTLRGAQQFDNARDKLYRERIEQMTLDNQSLQRRLNQVNSELERMQFENENIVRQIEMTDGDVRRLEQLLHYKDDVDAQNNVMQNDLERMKDANNVLNQKVKEEEFRQAETVNKLNQVHNYKTNTIQEHDHISHDFNIKLNRLDTLSREKAMVTQQLTSVNIDLERLSREDRILSHENIDKEQAIARLQMDRRELLEKIERITHKYESTVKEVNFSKKHLTRDNDWHYKIIVFKKLHLSLEIMLKKRKQATFIEIRNYSVFDSNCHHKLRQLATRMEKAGHYQLRKALNKWYDRSLKPFNTRMQNDDISIMIDCNKLLSKVFYAWKQYQQHKMDTYHFKTNAIQKIWNRLFNDSLQEKKRALDIWKHKQGYEGKKHLRLRRIFKKKNDRRCEDAFQVWLRYSKELEYHCRVKVLHMNFTRKVYLSHVFHEFRDQVMTEKQNRIRILNSFYKAWQDYIRYNRHLMQANMAAIAFRQSNEKYTLRACYQALRHHTESKKFALVHHAVKNDFDVSINELNGFNKDKNKKLLTKNQLRASNITRDMMAKKLFSYVQKWKQETFHFNFTMENKVKIKILNVYLNLMKDYMYKWKKHVFDKETLKKMKAVQELQQSIQARTNEALKQEGVLRQNVEKDKSHKRRIIDKNFRKLFYRRLQAAINRWKDILTEKKSQEDGVSKVVIRRMRNRFLRQAFDRYKNFYQWHKQHKKNEKRADYISDTIRLRTLRKMYNAICYFTKRQKRIKQSWHKVLFKFDYFQKMRAIKIWNEGSHLEHEDKLKDKQILLTNLINEKQDALNTFQVQTHGQGVFIKSQQNNLERKAYRQIGNAFLRQYTNNTQRYFSLWKARSRYQKECQQIMKRSIEHYRKRYQEQIHRVFLKFLSDDRRRERLEQIKQTQTESYDLNLAIENARKNHVVVKSKHQGEMGETNCASKETERKVLHTMEWMAQNNLKNVWRSKKRVIFEMWRTVCKEEKAFAYAVANVMTKTLWKEGFHRIKHQSRDIDFTSRVHRMFYLYSHKGQRIKIGDSFTKWKRFAFKKVDKKYNALQEELKKHQDNFDAFRDKVSETNMKRVCGFLFEKNLQNVFKAWKNVYKQQKLVKAKAVEFKQRSKKLQQQWALRTWSNRKDQTDTYRTKIGFVEREYQKLYLRSCFNGWKKHYINTKRLCQTISNLEKLMRGKVAYADTFKILKTYSTSKKLVVKNNFKTGLNNLKALFHGIYIKKLNQGFQKYKEKAWKTADHNKKFKGAYMKCFGYRLRDVFNWWKKKHNMVELKYDLHHTGPVRAQYWLAQREIENMKQFMRDQHYSEDEIDKFYGTVCKTNDYLMKKYMIRYKYINDPKKRLFVYVIDRWKGFVAIRKNVKHQFRYLANFKENNKAEMQMAFNKWRRGPDRLEQELWRQDIKTLENLGYRTTKELAECSGQIAENQAINNHLVLQRDEFLNYYIKGQVLAMALVKDRTEFAKMQGMSRWLRDFRKQWISEMKIMLRDDTNYLANQTERRDMLEAENANMEEENEEMRQFQKDGEIVKRNKARLQDECEAYRDEIANLEEEMKKLQEEKFDLLAKISEQEEITKNNQAQGKPNALAQRNKEAQLKKQGSLQSKPMPDLQEETEEQKAQRLKMEQLDKLRKTGPALR